MPRLICIGERLVMRRRNRERSVRTMEFSMSSSCYNNSKNRSLPVITGHRTPLSLQKRGWVGPIGQDGWLVSDDGKAQVNWRRRVSHRGMMQESKVSRGEQMAYGLCRTGLGDEMRRRRRRKFVARCRAAPPREWSGSSASTTIKVRE